MAQPILVVKDLCKVTRKRAIIKHVSFTVEEGELFGLLGPNGAGKSTLLRMLVGLVRPTLGRIYIAGHCVKRQFRSAIRYVDCMLESPPTLYPFLTGRQNLQLLRNMSPSSIPKERLNEVAEQMKMTQYLNHKVKTYSTGMKQRLGIAQALLTKPKLLLLDEPTNGLDPLGIQELRTLLQGLVENQQVSVLFSTHLLHETEILCHRIAMIYEGVLLYLGSPRIQNTSDKQEVIWKVRPLKKAVDSLKNHPTISGEVRTLSPDGMIVTMETTSIAALTRFLVEQEIQVEGIRVRQPTLEEHFIAKTTGGTMPL
ncbi:ABC transporter ATP-binding protein [Pasteuria penetrans]|uniref:ABC transporter ATP-binding protein n=1 Tax=Pasteuria penetrans TaxID=86005 RepID=UPI000FA9D9BD|nr:ABC transporter ATP-binding protein [Pasteuria penetrans]